MLRVFIFLFSLLMFTSTSLQAADYYWVGGSGDWSDINHWATSSGGTTKHIQTPTSNDNVIFDANSMSAAASINLNSQTILCRDFNVENISKALVFTGICQVWRIYGGIKLSPSFIPNAAKLYFEALNGTHYIKTNSKKILVDIYFKGTAIWTLLDSLECFDIYLESGSLNSNSFGLDIRDFKSNSTYSRTMNITNSFLRVASWRVVGSGYSVNATNSNIFFKSFNKSFQHSNTGNLNYYNLTFLNAGYLHSLSMSTTFHRVVFKDDGGITGDNTFDSLVFVKGGTYTIGANKTQTIIQDFIANGSCKAPITISSSNGFALFSKSSGSIICNYLTLLHIHAGGGASFYANAGVDLGDNIGWIMQLPISRNMYWVGGDGVWADTTHWSLTSGGIGGECIPTIVDNVVFDNNSFPNALDTTNEMKLKKVGLCHDFRWENSLKGKIIHSDTLTISGSCFLGKHLNLKKSGEIKFVSKDLGETIQTNNIELHNQEIRFTGTGSWQLLDSLKNGIGNIYHFNGHLKTIDQYVHTKGFYSSDKKYKELSFGSSVIDVVYRFYLKQDSLIVHPNTSHIRMLGDSSEFETIGINPAGLYNLTFVLVDSRGMLINNGTQFNKISFFQNMNIEGSAISDTLFFDKGHDYIFYNRRDSIVKKLIANANCLEPISMRESLSLDNFYFKMGTTASVDVSYVNMRGCHIIGQGPFLAQNCGDLGMNINWTFSYNSVNHYWVGGQGNWQDQSHWSYSSGGTGGACIPMIYDDVYFDANSFNSSFDTVFVDTMNTYCRKMSWLNATNNPVFYNKTDFVSYISGSVKLISNMDFYQKGETYFVWEQNNKTIDMAGQSFIENITLCDTGSWTLLDTLQVEAEIYHAKGKLLANQYIIEAERYIAAGSFPKTLDIQNNEVHITLIVDGMFLWNQNNQTQLLANNSHIIFIGNGVIQTQGVGQVHYFNVSFIDSNMIGQVVHKALVTNTFNRLFFQHNGDIYGQNSIDTLIFSKGGRYQFESGFDQFILHKWKADADCYGTITVLGKMLNSTPAASNIHMVNGNVLLHSVLLRDITAIGNGSFSILDGVDLGGNSSNWQITPTVSRTLYWVNEGGDWFDTTHWSFSSGGVGGECIPTYKDDVYFDTASFTMTDKIAFATAAIDCHNMLWRWTPEKPQMKFNNKMNIYGSISLGDTLVVSGANLRMHALDTTNYIRTSAHLISNVSFISQGGWYLMDSLNVADGIIHFRGSFRSMGQAISANYYISSYNNARKLDIQNSEVSLSRFMTIQSNAYNLISTNSHIKFDNNAGLLSLKVLGGKSLHFNEVSFMPVNKLNSIIDNTTLVKQYFNKVTMNNNSKILGENEFDTLIFRAGNTYELEYDVTQRVNDYWLVRGNNCYAINLQSTKKNYQAYVQSSNAIISGDFINMRDIGASGGTVFYAGNFSTDISNNSGWTFSNGPQYVYGLGPDVTFNLGGSTTLSTVNFNGGPNTSYLWSTGSTNPNIIVNQTGWYFVTVTYAGGCVVVDSIFVGCDLKMGYKITDNICNGDSLGLIQAIVPDPNYQYVYLWNTGDTSSFTDSLFAGKYIVFVSADSGLCVVVDTLEVNEPPPVICPQGDTAFCVDDSVMLDLGSFVTYVWNDSYQGQYRWMNQPDTFVISVEDVDGCWSVPDTISIREDQRPIVYLGPDTTICLNESILLDAGSGMDDYLWSSNSAMSTLQVYYIGVYWVRVREKTCIVSDTIELFNCPPKFIVPNVFTPNGDGYNDVFNIDYQNIWEFEVIIYDRWGVKVFQSTNLENPWNGKVNGRDAAEGVYFWQIIYQEYNGKGGGFENKMVRGTVSLFRESKY